MKILCILLLGIYLWAPSQAFMNDEIFSKIVVKQWDCYRKNDRYEELINGQPLPIPNTIEAFVTLLERIEDRNPTWAPADIIKRLLINFRFDDAIYNANSFKFKSRDGTVVKVYEILNALSDRTSSDTTIRDGDILTREERCALYYMISHTVNETARQDEEFVGEKKFLKYPREQGLVTHGLQARGSFALGKVLLGILAGLQNSEDVDALATFRKLTPIGDVSDILNDVKISPLYASTFAVIVSMTKLRVNDNDLLLYGNGRWNEAVCPTSYILAGNREIPDGSYTATYSLFRGALDGYILGGQIKEMTSKYPNLRISQVLRSYYSGQPLKEFEKYTYCNRHILYSEGTMKTELVDRAIAYDKLFTRVSGQAGEEADAITKDINTVFNTIDGNTNEILDSTSREPECTNAASISNKMCDTPADIIAIMDFKTTPENKWTQSQIIGNVTSGFKMGRLASTAALFTNLKGYGGGFNIDAVFNNETNFTSGCSACAARYYEPLRTNANSEVEVIRELNRTMAVMEESTSELPAMNAKVVLYFNYGNPNDDYQLREALWDFRRTHSMTRVLAFGSRKETLDPFVRNRERDLIVDLSKLKDLSEKVCKVPAQFQYKNCYRRTDNDEASAKLDGFITPNKFQYWTMDPKYFLKSFKIELTFKSLTGNMRVCYSRDYSTIFDNKDPREDCKDLSPNEEKTYYVENPCKRRTEETCDPFYFYIEGKTSSEICTDKKCKTPNDIQYEFVHKGISCNSATSLTGMASVFFWIFAGVITWLVSARR